MNTILTTAERVLNEATLVGGKARSLAIAKSKGLPVPRYCVVVCDVAETTQESDHSLFLELQEILKTHFQDVSYFAVRSSAQAEDGTTFSFAGMLESHLYVPTREVPEKIAQVWASAFSEQVVSYCNEHGLTPPTSRPAVIVQEMIASEKSGVAFSVDPVSGSRNLSVVSAVWGLGSGLVSGECESDVYYVTHHLEVVKQRIATKTHFHQKSAEASPVKVETREVPVAKQEQSVLEPGEIRSVAHLAQQAAMLFGVPQDIEWTLAKGHLSLLQSRPITILPPPTASGAERWHEWNNTPVIESWPGVITPLTYSFAKRLQVVTYREMTRLTCLPKQPIAHFESLYSELTGTVQGQIYMDQAVLNELWFLAPSLVYRLNECKQIANGLFQGQYPTRQLFCLALQRLIQHGFQSAMLLLKLIKHYLQLPGNIKTYDQHLAPLLEVHPNRDLQRQWEEITALFEFLDRYGFIPTLNTYFANRLLDFLNLNTGIHLLIEGSDSIAEPCLSHQFLAQLHRVGESVQQTPEMISALQHASLEEIETQLADYPEIIKRLKHFFAQFGDRCEADLKLESMTWQDNPLPLFRTLGLMATSESPQRLSREKKQEKAQVTLRQKYYTSAYQKCLIQREHLRLQQSRLVGALRKKVLIVGDLLSSKGILTTPRDILFLHFSDIERLLAALDNMATVQEIQTLIQHRKNQYEGYCALPPLPDQFRAWGPLTPDPLSSSAGEILLQEKTMHGQACSTGRVEGEIVWYCGDADIGVYHGKILAAPYGDPSLVNIYPVIKGLLLERGSLLSHPAIVARELNLPTIVGLPGLSRWLKNHDRVSMDGHSGVIILETRAGS